MAYVPIIIFAFNRLNALKRLVASLEANNKAAESVPTFVDGVRPTKVGEAEKVKAWGCAPYMQYFCDEAFFQHRFPFDPSDFVHLGEWREQDFPVQRESLRQGS